MIHNHCRIYQCMIILACVVAGNFAYVGFSTAAEPSNEKKVIEESSMASENIALLFDSDDYVSVPNTSGRFTLTDSITVEAWVKPMGDGSLTLHPIVWKVANAGNHQDNFGLWWYSANESTYPERFAFKVERASDDDDFQVYSAPHPPNQYYHVAGVYDGQDLKIYVNGVLEGSLETGPVTPYSGPAPLIIGSNFTQGSGTNSFDGVIDEVRIWSASRSETEIRSNIYQTLNGDESGLEGYWRFALGEGQVAVDYSQWGNDGQLGSLTTADDNDPSWLVLQPGDLNLPPLRPYSTINLNADSIVPLDPFLTASSFIDLNDEDTHMSSHWQLRASASELDYSSTVFDSGDSSVFLIDILIPPGLLDYSTPYSWRVRYQDNQGNWSAWSDEAGFTTLSNPALPEEDYSLLFDQGDYVEAPNRAGKYNLTNAMTVEAWVKPVSNGAPEDRPIVWKSASSSNNQDNFGLRWFSSASTGYPERFSFRIERASDDLDFDVYSEPHPPMHFYHVAAVYDGSDLSIYVDGVLEGSITIGNVTPYTGPLPLLIGSSFYRGDGEFSFGGIIDEVRIWNVARTQEQIQDYQLGSVTNEPGLIGYWRFNEGAGQVAQDLSYSGNDGQLGSLPGVDDNDPQWQAVPSLEVTPSVKGLGSRGGKTSFLVNIMNSNDAQWQADVIQGETWLSVIAGINGSGQGEVTAHCAVNDSPSSRTGIIRVLATETKNYAVDLMVTQQGDAGWIYNSDTGHYYRLTSSGTWTEAKAEAESAGGYLVAVGSEAENQWLCDTFGPIEAGIPTLWLGFTDEGSESNFRWVNGESVAYTNWSAGNPSNALGIEHYAWLNTHFATTVCSSCPAYFWDDVANDKFAPGIIEAEYAPDAEARFGCFIDRQYADFLNRAADQGGRQFYLDHLAAGTMTLDVMVRNFIASPEFEENNGFIARCYFALFNNNSLIDYNDPGYRYPDAGGQHYWHDRMAEILALGGTLRDAQLFVILGFTNSPEWQARVGQLSNEEFVEFLYKHILGRAPEPEGYAFHLANLNANLVTREDLVCDFINAAETVAKYWNYSYVVMAYLGLLDREPDRTGFVYHVARLENGETDVVRFLNGFIYAPEYFNRLQSLGCMHPGDGG